MSDYIVEAKSRKELRRLAFLFRQMLGLENYIRMPVVELLELLPDIFDRFSSEIVSNDTFPPGTHAETDIQTGHITIAEEVYERACNGEGRDRMTIAHEIGHFLMLDICGFKLQRRFYGQEVKQFNDPEWQAKCFAGELLVPYHLTQNMTAEEIAKACGVSLEAADYQLKHRG